MKQVLVLFSDPPDEVNPEIRLRLDKEDRLITALASRFAGAVQVHRQHASETADIHNLLIHRSYNVIQFSGHGNSEGIVLDKTDMGEGGELVSPLRLQSLLSIPETPPTLVILLSCYSAEALPILAQVAPFVITATGPLSDACSLDFISCFYERFFGDYSIQHSFEHAKRIIESKGKDCHNIRLDRRFFIQKGSSKYIESTPDLWKESVLVNLDAVVNSIAALEIPEEEVLHLISKKLSVHRWIFDVPRERCVIPIGRMLFGEFAWKDANDVVLCTKLARLRADVPPLHWQTWHKLLLLYNDLASNDYRAQPNPAEAESRNSLLRAVNLLSHYVSKYIQPSRDDIAALGFLESLPYVEFITTHSEIARDQFDLERFPQVVKSLEEALTNFHELVESLTPPVAKTAVNKWPDDAGTR
ncbi:MAG: hypothetical protein IPN92_00505 [Chromatiaceae bacterium]|nr:hypothetical protein [Chromatiaceae bacterium]